MQSVDVAFGHAARKCGEKLNPKRDENGEFNYGNELADILRSNRILTEGEREVLAQLVTGELSPVGRQILGPGAGKFTNAFELYFKILDNGKLEKVAFSEAKELYEKYHGPISESQLRHWIAERRSLDAERAKQIKSTLE